MQADPRANFYAGWTSKISLHILCGTGQPALPSLLKNLKMVVVSSSLMDALIIYNSIFYLYSLHSCSFVGVFGACPSNPYCSMKKYGNISRLP